MTVAFLGLALVLSGAVLACVLRRRAAVADAVFLTLTLGGFAVVGVSAAWVLATGDDASIVVRSWMPGGDWAFLIDRLSAVFLLGICGVGAAGVAFGAPYLAPERHHRPVWFLHAAVAVLLAALCVVVTAASVVPFFIGWEVMAIGSYVLIVAEDERADVRRAGLIYLVATHTGMLALVAMFAVWGAGVHAADWSFAALRVASPARAVEAAVLVLAIVGFGFKAGIVPFHFWLPPAHAAAPSHVSALLSGLVIKTGVYGIFRVISLFGAPLPAWWGWSVLLLGAVSGVLGVLWALAQHDIKRLLAYHSVENIGIIFMGIGVGALGARYGNTAVEVIGYAGALLHTINHALFKSLLFLGAGVVQRATGTRNMEELGGLARQLPYTWLAFFVGATAIVGVPPLNGFVSEWLVYQGLFRAGQTHELLRLASLGVLALALIGALALACFAKVAGVVFLGSPRSVRAVPPREAGRGMLIPMAVLAGVCVVLGAVPALGVVPAVTAAMSVAPGAAAAAGDAIALSRDAALIGGMAFVLLSLIGAAGLLRRRLLRAGVVRSGATWACGFENPPARAQYTASSFAGPLLATFGRMSGVDEHRGPASFGTHAVDLVLDRLVVPAWHGIHRAAIRLRPIQQGRLWAYLLYVMVALIVLLIYLALAT